ncbi:MAG: tetratricopeptide repeat protein [Candidatus Methanofastidiosia archaeon]
MRCKACMRTVTPSKSQRFSGFDFCTACYEALELRSLEKKEKSTNHYIISLSNENNHQLFEALLDIASKFDKKAADTLLIRCNEMIGRDTAGPQEVLACLLAAHALQESIGEEPLNTVSELAVYNIGKRLAAEIFKSTSMPIPDELLDEEAMRDLFTQLSWQRYTTCIDVFSHITPSENTGPIKEYLANLADMCQSMAEVREVDCSRVDEGVYLNFPPDLTSSLLETLGNEHAFDSWDALKEGFQKFQEEFLSKKIKLIFPEGIQDHKEIHVLIEDGELYITSQWEKIKERLDSEGADAVVTLMKEIPHFVVERAAGGIDNLRAIVEKGVPGTDNADLVLLYSSLLKEQDNLEQAVTMLEEKTAAITDEPSLVIELALQYIETGEVEKAIDTLKKVADMEPDNWLHPMFIAEVYENMGKFKEAVEYYRKASTLTTPDPYLLSSLKRAETGEILAEIEDLISKEHYQEALTLVEKHFDPFEIDIFHYYKGVILARMRASRDALAVITDYLDIYSDDEEGWLEKAGIYLDLGNFAAAARSFRQCSMLTPKDVRPLVWEALCHKRLGRSRYYKRCINQARKTDPEKTKALLKELPF